MSDFTVIRAASDTLKSILETGITNSPDPQLNGVPIDLRSPSSNVSVTMHLPQSRWILFAGGRGVGPAIL